MTWASLVAQIVKNLPAMQETQLESLGLNDPLEKGTATQSSLLAWRIPRTEEPGGLQSAGLPRVRHDLVTKQPEVTVMPLVHGPHSQTVCTALDAAPLPQTAGKVNRALTQPLWLEGSTSTYRGGQPQRRRVWAG